MILTNAHCVAGARSLDEDTYSDCSDAVSGGFQYQDEEFGGALGTFHDDEVAAAKRRTKSNPGSRVFVEIRSSTSVAHSNQTNENVTIFEAQVLRRSVREEAKGECLEEPVDLAILAILFNKKSKRKMGKVKISEIKMAGCSEK